MIQKFSRAKPLPVEDRQDMIIDAVIPLLMERGHAVTTKQIADAAGIAEGTIFRAFGDKETLVRAAIERHFDPAPLRASLARIDPALPLEDKIRIVIELLQARFGGIVRMMSVMGHGERPVRPTPPTHSEYAGIVAQALAPDLDRLNWPAERVAPLIRLIAFSTSIPMFTEATPFTTDELTRFVLYGIAGHPAPELAAATSAATAV
ncbi:TetR/AcrR family transcriptional regulator [Glaciibacter sp. 2TAF33]|uniref:TetR/AcrR family transcriptional regulator n=1 Tax=Glaciibacter sp. 2TAF33 TaxID=3233015 RepID=UPI003F932968